MLWKHTVCSFCQFHACLCAFSCAEQRIVTDFSLAQGLHPAGTLGSSVFASFAPVCRHQRRMWCPSSYVWLNSFTLSSPRHQWFLVTFCSTPKRKKKSIFSPVPTLTSADIDGKQPNQCSLSMAAAWNVGRAALHLIPYYSSVGAAAGRFKTHKRVCAVTAPLLAREGGRGRARVCVWSVCVHTFLARLLCALNAPSDPASKS